MKKNRTYGLMENIGLLKMIKIMRFTIFILFLTLSQAFAVDSYSQQTKLSLDMRNARVEDVIDRIEKNSEFYFMYNKGMIDVERKVDIQVKEKNVNEVLDKIFAKTDIFYLIKDHQILLINSRMAGTANDLTTQQQKSISGKVTDSSGATLPGVSVVVKGTTTGVITDSNGNYSLSNVPENAIFQFSFVGMKMQEVAIGGKTTINVALEEETIGIEEVVAVGYGTMKKSDITGSLSSVSSNDFEKQPITRLDQALQGRVTGAQVTQVSGEPGGRFKVRIRGANSLSGSNEPLYVVDGIVVDNISSINANDIQSMEVLKDASSSAIYGSRSANGVILITTKDGKRGAPRITFDAYKGVSKVARKLDVMNAADFAEEVNSAQGSEVYSQQEIDALRVSGGEDWQNRIFNDAPFSNYQLTLDGGSKTMDFYISGNYYTTEGIIIDKDYTRYTLRAKMNADLSEKIRVGFNISGSRAETIGQTAILNWALTWDPTTPAYDENGQLNFAPKKNLVGNTSSNPLLAPTHNIMDNYNNWLNASGYFNFEIIKNLTLNIIGGVDRINRNNNSYEPIIINNTGIAEISNSEITKYQNTNRLTWVYEKKSEHRLQVDAIHEQDLYTSVSLTANSQGFFSDNTTYKKLSLAQLQKTSNGSSSSSLQSFMGRVNYSYLSRYLFTATMRADGSSKFREGHRWSIFPSGSVGWRISEEGFMKNIDAINNLKLRMSYGITGSQAIGPLATREQPIVGTGINYPFTGGTTTIGIAPSSRLANLDLTWEETAQSNIGIDLSLWKSRVTFTADAYKKHTYNLLLARALPSFVGPTVVTENVGEVENKGIEFSLGFVPIQTNDLTVTSNFTFNRNLNKVLALVTDDPIELGSGGIGGLEARYTRVEIGQPISAFRGYIFEGVYQLGEEEEAAKYGKVPGQAKYKDFSKDGKLTTDDITNVGDGNPDFTFGWNTTIEWKNLDINFLFTGSYGNDIYNIIRAQMMGLGSGILTAIHADYKDRWTPENTSNIPSGRNGTYILSTQFLEDGSFIALKNVSAGYTFNKNKAFNTIGLDLLRVYASIENAFLLTKYTGFNPESTGYTTDVDLGIDSNAYPLPRSFTLGVKLTF